MSRKMNQRNRILQYLENHGSITQKEANELGIFRLAARIMELRESGIDIPCDMMTGKNEYGTFHYARYRRA